MEITVARTGRLIDMDEMFIMISVKPGVISIHKNMTANYNIQGVRYFNNVIHKGQRYG